MTLPARAGEKEAVVPAVRLFRFTDNRAVELDGGHVTLERHLQKAVEANMETLFAVRFLASEYPTGERHGGRIDSLGIDENGSPVIFEYKRKVSESVIIQGLYYLDWLMDHKAEFQHLVRGSAHDELTEAIDWSAPRLVCVATDFTRYDRHAVQQIHRAIDLVRYRDFDGELLTLDVIHSNATDSTSAAARRTTKQDGAQSTQDVNEGEDVSAAEENSRGPGVLEKLEQASPQLRELFDTVADYCETVGEGVSRKTLKRYIAFHKLRNFATLRIRPVDQKVVLHLKVDPDSVELTDGFTRRLDEGERTKAVPLEVSIRHPSELDEVYALIDRAYENV